MTALATAAFPGPGELLSPERASRTVVAMAHPDDETAGFATQLPRLRDATFVYFTDGAPRDLADARRAGFGDWRSYARARRRELEAAFALAGIDAGRARFLDLPDQQASEHVCWLARRLQQILEQTRAVQVLTQPYEGGHPDHDAVAFAVHTACRLLAAERRPVPRVLEAPYYHNGGGRIVTGEFLPPAGNPVRVLELGAEERQFRESLLACFATQAPALRAFPPDRESFRPAPQYDFGRPPHSGPLLYEILGWEMTGSRWRALARAAHRRLGLPVGQSPVLQAVGAGGGAA